MISRARRRSKYRLIASLVSIAAISSFTMVGTKLSATFKFVAGIAQYVRAAEIGRYCFTVLRLLE